MRIIYPHLLTPHSFKGQEAKYSVGVLIPPTTDCAELNSAVMQAAITAWGADKERWSDRRLMPVGDAVKTVKSLSDEFKGWKFLRLKSKYAPDVIDAAKNKVTAPTELYNGRWAHVSIGAKPYAYNQLGNIGISLNLGNVMLLKHDTPIVLGGVSAKDEFAEFAEEINASIDNPEFA